MSDDGPCDSCLADASHHLCDVCVADDDERVARLEAIAAAAAAYLTAQQVEIECRDAYNESFAEGYHDGRLLGPWKEATAARRNARKALASALKEGR